MQDRPTKTELLDALGEFLLREVRPQVDDPALSFRILIAANLASIVAAENRLEDNQDAAQLQRLQLLMPDMSVGHDPGAVDRKGRQQAIATLNAELVERIRGGHLSDAQRAAIWVHMGETLREKLAVVNPRFDLSPTID